MLPYVVFFSLSVLLLKNFRKKDEMEKLQLITEDDQFQSAKPVASSRQKITLDGMDDEMSDLKPVR